MSLYNMQPADAKAVAADCDSLKHDLDAWFLCEDQKRNALGLR